MVKLVSKFGLGLVLGAWAGHYLSTEKGQAQLDKLKSEFQAYQADPEAYKVQVLPRIKSAFEEQLQTVYEKKEELLSELTPSEDEVTTAAEVDDIVITYTEEELQPSSQDL